MSESAPAPMPAFHYVVVSPFLDFVKGERITDAATIATVEEHYADRVVRVAA